MAKTLALYALGVGAILLAGILSLGIGRYEIGVGEILSCLQGSECSPMQHNVIFDFRLPRVWIAIFIGAGLSASGLAFQNLFRNPLATPDILGVTSGTSFGIVLALLLGLGGGAANAFGLLFGILALALVIIVSYDKGSSANTLSMILSGIIISALFQSLVSLLKYMADPQDELPTITYWLLGSLEAPLDARAWLNLGGIALGTAVIFIYRWKLNLLALSDEEAKALGVRLHLFRGVIILSCSVIVASAVSLCGLIGWVGLLVPHIARLIVGSENRRLVPLTLLIGSLFLMLVDALARSLSSAQIPISILTAVVGAPFFIYILHKNKGVKL